jgi:tetratricopeptide (TPR) repeat protein
MSTKAVQEKGSDKVTLSLRINDFLVKNRIFLVVVLIVFAGALISLVAVSVITENNNNVAFEAIDTAVSDWETARAATDKSGLPAKEDALLATLQKIAASNRNSYAGARAYMTIGEVYFSRKDWKNAQVNYLAAAKSAPHLYTAGLNYYNAGICADELGLPDEAIAQFNKALADDNFSLKPRALFSIGRIEEQRSNKNAAISAYEKMAEKYPDDEWTLIGKSRIIALQIQ